jgi:hypothetical protein
VLRVSVNLPYQLFNAWTNLYEIWYVYHGTISAAYLINPSISLCLHVYPFIVARQRIRENFTAAKNTHATIEEL